jgi:hypothetical protein
MVNAKPTLMLLILMEVILMEVTLMEVILMEVINKRGEGRWDRNKMTAIINPGLVHRRFVF